MFGPDGKARIHLIALSQLLPGNGNADAEAASQLCI